MKHAQRARQLVARLFACALVVVFAGAANTGFATNAYARHYHHQRYHKHHPRYEGEHEKPHVVPTPQPQIQSTQGVLIKDEQSGQTLLSVNETELFNPASNTKLATSLAVLRKFGPDYRFNTEVRYTGTLDANGVITGDLYVSGNYVLFGDDEVQALAKIIASRGIKHVTGDLIVAPDFSMDAENVGIDAGTKVKDLLSPPAHAGKRKTAVTKSSHLIIDGQVNLGAPPAQSVLVATHVSPPLKHILKRMLCPSDNEMAERLGEMIGGPQGLTAFVMNDVGVPAAEVQFASTSGLYVNRLSPPAMMKILEALKAELAKSGLTFADIMPVSGVDTGTMANRLNTGKQRGSVVAKTGTLPETDNGASALSGEMYTAKGTYMFVIFEIHGAVSTFKRHENQRVTDFQQAHGGARPIKYVPILPQFPLEGSWK